MINSNLNLILLQNYLSQTNTEIKEGLAHSIKM